jgi:general stress protein YciG
MATDNRGFASMDEEQQKDIARKGGESSPGNFKNDPARASEAGKSSHSKDQESMKEEEGSDM